MNVQKYTLVHKPQVNKTTTAKNKVAVTISSSNPANLSAITDESDYFDLLLTNDTSSVKKNSQSKQVSTQVKLI